MNDYTQFDTSETVIGGVNIAEAVQSDKKLVFNESYTIIGGRFAAPSVYACYDLTVIGDVEVEEIEVSGNLYVVGNIKAKQLSCLKAITCSGNIDAETIVGSEIVANDIACHAITCSGNIVVKTAIDVGESLETRKSVMAGEGILGMGRFLAKNAIASEYFDFDGEVCGKVLELETDSMFGEPHGKLPEEETLGTLCTRLKGKVEDELKRAGEVDEGQLLQLVNQLSEFDVDMVMDWERLTKTLVELTYLDQITNLWDYLTLVMAAKILPKEIIGYETIEYVFDKLLVEAEKELDALPFFVTNVEDFAYALKIVVFCENELKMDRDEALDRIFQSIGIKYRTVKSFLEKQ